jgi:predicted TIM-barrel fold metal-dependent hydrolase
MLAESFAGVDEADKQKIFWKNAADLYGIKMG